jgi:hypothetical protein
MKKKVNVEKEINPKSSVYLFREDHPTGKIFKFVGGSDSDECRELLENGWFDTPARLDLPERSLELTTEQVEKLRPEDLIKMLQSYGFIVLTPEQLTAEVNKLVGAHVDIEQFTDEAFIAEAERRGLKQSDDIEEPSEHEHYAQFVLDAVKLSKPQLKELGLHYGLKLSSTMSELTMINKIDEVVLAIDV